MTRLRIVRFRASESPELLAQAWRLRHRVFRENLGWEVPSIDLLEFDHFDRSAVHVGVLERDRLVGYWRSLCTVEPYLLELHFPMLLGGRAPKSSSVWEISRFAVQPKHPDSREIGKLLVREIAAFGRDVDAERLIAVTEPTFERFVKQCGLAIDRAAGPVVVGRGAGDREVHAVVISCDINPRTLAGVGLLPKQQAA